MVIFLFHLMSAILRWCGICLLRCYILDVYKRQIVGALIIKELFALSDDEIVENLMLDIHYQYALHTTSYEEQPLSDKSLSRFRKRCYEYEKTRCV